ncbi:putative ubiquitin conjugation factor E4 [Thelohanellus kitauei]|uniref:Ubiquitin conjugation factor E4 A n=1 Tax=Thelohanellus kitauei TaxID=669202 RepID=A0A0C2JRL9_THEKT|nr:putative ubiquitin conjugation factor E4 [Thelohanellus kitauei]
MVDRIAAMLNYFLRQLVGEKKKDLKVRDMDKLNFQPKELVKFICQIFVDLTNNEAFCKAVCSDTRSFTADLPDLALNVLKIIGADPILVENFQNCKERLLQYYGRSDLSEPDGDEIPDEFLDPISYTLMRDPVMLPASKVIVDRSTITKHLLR